MNTLVFSTIAVVFYTFAPVWWGWNVLRTDRPKHDLKVPLLIMGGIALVCHGLVLYFSINVTAGVDLGFYNALSLMAWVVTLLLLLTILFRPVENLAVIVLPVAALAILLSLFFHSQHIFAPHITLALRIHILASAAAYAILSIAAVQSIVVAYQEHQLRNKHPVRAMHLLPPLQVMEDLLVQMLLIGFFVLTLSVITGLMFVNDILGQHLAHKMTFSVLAWFVFGTVLVGRWKWGWRSRKLFRWTLLGLAFLVLAYFGSKFVLELVLDRV